MPDEKPQPMTNLDEAVEGASNLLDEDFRDETPSPQPRQQQPSPQANELALDIRAGMIEAGFDPDQMSPAAYQQLEEIVAEQHSEMLRTRAAQEFLRRHADDYVACMPNAEALQTTLQSLGYDGSDVREIEVAFQQLKASGRILGPQKQMSMSLSDRSAAREPIAQPMDDESFRRELERLPLDQARRLVMRQRQ